MSRTQPSAVLVSMVRGLLREGSTDLAAKGIVRLSEMSDRCELAGAPAAARTLLRRLSVRAAEYGERPSRAAAAELAEGFDRLDRLMCGFSYYRRSEPTGRAAA